MFSSFVCEHINWSVMLSLSYVFHSCVALDQVEAEGQKIKVYNTPYIDHLRLIMSEIKDKINIKGFVLHFCTLNLFG